MSEPKISVKSVMCNEMLRFANLWRGDLLINRDFYFHAGELSKDLVVNNAYNMPLLEQAIIEPVSRMANIKRIADEAGLRFSAVLKEDTVPVDHDGSHTERPEVHDDFQQYKGLVVGGAVHNRNFAEYVSIDEIKEITHSDDENIIRSTLYETAIYRFYQRHDWTMLSSDLIALLELHRLRLFMYFVTTSDIEATLLLLVVAKINDNKDRLCKASIIWNEQFDRQCLSLAITLCQLANKHSISQNDVLFYAHTLSAECASVSLSIDPITGELYISDFISYSGDKPQLELKVRHTTAGLLKKNFERNNLLYAEAVTLRQFDVLKTNSEGLPYIVRRDCSCKEREVLGAWAMLYYADGSHTTEFVSEKELQQVAELSGNDTWFGVFADKMREKQALLSLLRQTDWSIRPAQSKLKQHFMNKLLH
ncbi:hypothetical protein LRP52_37120 [Photobacterium sp. ZSDE20]|uniref:Uncharacterized protein n=1 Tax=Photobacterium pectinilyticum TaxID=2906793 RepID=A0ABT1N9T0_9GAMM|nr:hypothetical protein [Photobacterium sp. ZSDE20]MCQ1060614.1 hypothetical protein [Photobacterium sp. ZSDE20]MDD1827809.1 hypothetical protein [Photobacterium sp. ZSDE20]